MTIKSVDVKILISLVLALIVFGIVSMFNQNPQRDVIRGGGSIGTASVDVEVARTPVEQALGLSNRATLPENQGMLFIYDEPHFPSIWMKDMKFPIDIIWIGDDLTVVDLTENISPSSFPKTFSPGKAASYVLEVNVGFARGHAIKIGDKVKFTEY